MQDKYLYLASVLVFSAIFFVGRIFFQWGQIASACLLMFFFLVLIGIRLDEISKKINAVNDRLEDIARGHLASAACDGGSQGERGVTRLSDAPDDANRGNPRSA
jgi:hypothetical protein